jgi:hypothetical protein
VDPRPRFHRSLFGYRPAQVRAFVAGVAGEGATPDRERPAEGDVRELEDELQGAQAQLTAQSAALRAAQAAMAESSARAGEAERRAGDLEADLERATEQLEASAEDARAAHRQIETLTARLDALRAALTVEIKKVWTAELQAHELGTELATARDALADTREQLRSERARADEAERRADEAERRAARATDEAHAAPWTTDELAPVFDLTERTVTGIIEEARRRGDAELGEVEHRLDLLRSQTRQLEDWRDRVEPFVTPVRRSIDQARVEAERVGGMIRQALEPMTTAVTALGERLVDLAAAARDPLEPSAAPDGDAERDEAPTPARDAEGPSTADPPVDVADDRDDDGPRIVDLSDAPADSSTA